MPAPVVIFGDARSSSAATVPFLFGSGLQSGGGGGTLIMAQILLHKQELTPEQIAKLEAEGVIAIRTQKPRDFQFLDLTVPMIELNDMVWALLDAANTEKSGAGDVRRTLVQNLAVLADEKRAARKRESDPAAAGER
jgi:hypothetical protein